MFIFFLKSFFKTSNFRTFSFLCLTLNIFLLHYSNSSWNIIHLYFSTCLHIHAFSVCNLCLLYLMLYCKLYSSTLLRYSFSTHIHLYACMILVLYCKLYACTVLRHSFSTPLHFYTSTPLHLCISKPQRLYASTPLRLYASTPLRLYTSSPLYLNASTPLHLEV